MSDKKRHSNNVDQAAKELRDLLPEDINDGDIELPKVKLDPVACLNLKKFLHENLSDGERADQVYYSTVKFALRRHAAADPTSVWSDLAKSIARQANDALALHRALSTAEEHASSTPRRREASFLTRAAGVVEAEGSPRHRSLNAEARVRVQHDPLRYLAVTNEMKVLREAVEVRLKVLYLATGALNSRPGRPRGSVLDPLVNRLASYWEHATQAKPTYGRKDDPCDGPSEVQYRSVITGRFFRYCELALECLPEDKRHGRRFLKSVVRRVCDAGGSIKASHTDDLYRI